jgi:hypothetical protein
VDDLDKSAPLVVGEAPRRSTSSLGLTDMRTEVISKIVTPLACGIAIGLLGGCPVITEAGSFYAGSDVSYVIVELG